METQEMETLFTYLPGWHMHIVRVVLKNIVMNADGHPSLQTHELTRVLTWTTLRCGSSDVF